MKKKLIIINRMYAGKYLTIGENIGHEIINLIRSDNGNNYLWLNADGNCDISRFIDKKGNHLYDEIVMLMVRMYGHRKWKILAKAEIDTATLAEYMAPKYTKEFHNTQIRKIIQEKINYGGQPVNKIYENNYFDGKIQSDIDIYFTFKAKSVHLPVFTPENMEKTVVDIEGLTGLANQSLRMYLTEEKNIETYNTFNAIIEGEAFAWETENTTQKVDINTTVAVQQDDYFLRIINEEYRELTFSNLLAYFLKNKKIMAGFAAEVLHLENFNAETYSIAREEKNIDLFISSPEYYIIIENKIRSGLIREEKSMEKKMLDYFDVTSAKKLPEQAVELLAALESADFYYQTDRYYAYACGAVFRRAIDAKIRGYVLFPNYAWHGIQEQLQMALFREHFTPITYKQVYSYFCTLKGSEILSQRESKYLEEFLAAMELHIREVDNSFEEEMQNRFYNRIKASSFDA